MKKVRNLVIACMAIMAACMLQNNDAKAAEVGKYDLSDTSVNTDYDVTGDGVEDTVRLKKLNHNGSNYCALDVIINGDVALNVEFVEYVRLESVFIQTQDHGYILISTYHDNDYLTFSRIYEYVDGKLKQRMDLDNVAGKIFYQYSPNVYAVKDESIQMRFAGQSNMLAKTSTVFEYNVGSTGALSLDNTISSVWYSNTRMNENTGESYSSKYLVAAKRLQAYRSSTGTKKAFAIKKGTKLKITKVSISGKTPRFYCITNSGKKGWVISKQNVFKDLMYSG